MKWQLKEPRAGDMIRVRLGALYHYGIYVSDGEVIEFGPPPVRPIPPSEIRVISAGIDDFLAGGFLEVAEFDKKEKKKNRTPDRIVRYARERVGDGGYDILKNNCEHFAYECVTGVARSTQTDGISLPGESREATLYIAPLPDRAVRGHLYPREREEYVLSASSDVVRRERFYIWRLLEFALGDRYGKKLKKLKITRHGGGMWSVDGFHISLSHGGGVLAVALADFPVGVDVECIGTRSLDHLCERVLTKEELDRYLSAEGEQRAELMLSFWTKKEAEYKRRATDEVFSPKNISSTDGSFVTDKIAVGGKNYLYALATGEPASVRVISLVPRI